jgi:AcrR family transcriptional regulator
MSSGTTARLPKEQRRAQLLDAARTVFVESGYYSAGMDDIADRAGVSKPVLYQHFPSKLDLYLALLDAGLEELIASTAIAVREISDNKIRIQETMRAYFAFVDNPDSAYRLVFESDLMNEPQVRTRVEAADHEIAKRIARVIAEDTGLRPDEALLLGSGMQGMAQVAARRWLSDDHDAIDREAAADLIAALAWRGIRGFPLTHPPHGEATNHGAD